MVEQKAARRAGSKVGLRVDSKACTSEQPPAVTMVEPWVVSSANLWVDQRVIPSAVSRAQRRVAS